jgi:signal peptidase I
MVMAVGDEVVDRSDGISQIAPAMGKPSRRRLGAALVSAILPGLGQLLLGAKRRALFYFISLLVVALLYWPVRLPTTYGGFIVLVWLTFVPPLMSVRDALRARPYALQPRSRWWLALFIPLALLFSTVYINFLFRAAGFRNYSVPSPSMETTIGNGSLLVADLFAYHHSVPGPYEVILFRRDKIPFVKRVIAGPGSTIEGKESQVLVDGKYLSEPYARHTGAAALPVLVNFGPTPIPAGKLFVMGDNRDVSYDSRVRDFGLVDISDVLGKPLYIYRSSKGWRGRDIH